MLNEPLGVKMRYLFFIVLFGMLGACETAQEKQIRLAKEQREKEIEQLHDKYRAEVWQLINSCTVDMKKRYPQKLEEKLVNEQVHTGDKVTGSRRVCMPASPYTNAWCFDKPLSEPIYSTVAVLRNVDVNAAKRDAAIKTCTCKQTKNTKLEPFSAYYCR